MRSKQAPTWQMRSLSSSLMNEKLRWLVSSKEDRASTGIPNLDSRTSVTSSFRRTVRENARGMKPPRRKLKTFFLPQLVAANSSSFRKYPAAVSSESAPRNARLSTTISCSGVRTGARATNRASKHTALGLACSLERLRVCMTVGGDASTTGLGHLGEGERRRLECRDGLEEGERWRLECRDDLGEDERRRLECRDGVAAGEGDAEREDGGDSSWDSRPRLPRGFRPAHRGTLPCKGRQHRAT